jgi:hypothetical protein
VSERPVPSAPLCTPASEAPVRSSDNVLMMQCDPDSGLVRGWVGAPPELGVYPPTHPLGGGGSLLPDPTHPPTHLGGEGVPSFPQGVTFSIFTFKITIHAHKPPKIAVRVKNELGDEHCPRRLMPE